MRKRGIYEAPKKLSYVWNLGVESEAREKWDWRSKQD